MASGGVAEVSDGSAATPMWTPPEAVWAAVPPGGAAFIVALVLWRDGRGSCDPTEEEIGGLLRRDVSTVRRWGKEAAKTELVKRERRRRPDNTRGGYRYWLDLEKLGLSGGDRSDCAVAPPPVRKAQPCEEPTAQDARSPVDNTGATAQPTAQDERSGPGKLSGPIKREGARARVLSNPIPPSFAFRNSEQKAFMEAVAAACGVGLCRFDECEGLAESLAIAMDKWLVEGFDPDIDIVPTLKRLTAHHRAKPVYDFGVEWITKDIRDHHAARLAREAKRAAKAAGGVASADAPRAKRFSPSVSAAERAANMHKLADAIEAGTDRSIFNLQGNERWLEGAELDAAFARRVADLRAKASEMETADGGGGDGA